MTKIEIIKRLDEFVGSRAMGCYAYEQATLPNLLPPTDVYGVGGSYDYTIQQSRQEIYTFIDVLLQVEPRDVILETGAGEWIGSHYLWQALFEKIITIEQTQSIIDKISYPVGSQDIFIVGDSRNSLDEVKKYTDKLDVLFIDSDHKYEVAKAEYNLYSPMVREGGLVVFHDALSPLFPEMEWFMRDFMEGKIDGKSHKVVLIDDSPGNPIGIAYCSVRGDLPIPESSNWRWM